MVAELRSQPARKQSNVRVLAFARPGKMMRKSIDRETRKVNQIRTIKEEYSLRSTSNKKEDKEES